MVLHRTNLLRHTEGSREASAVAAEILVGQSLRQSFGLLAQGTGKGSLANASHAWPKRWRSSLCLLAATASYCERARRLSAPSRGDIAKKSASRGKWHGEPLPLAPWPRPQPQPAAGPAARPLAVAAARPLAAARPVAAPRPEPLADARQDRRRHGRARHGHGLPLERPRLRVHQAGAFYRVL